MSWCAERAGMTLRDFVYHAHRGVVGFKCNSHWTAVGNLHHNACRQRRGRPMNSGTNFKSVRDTVSAEEWQARLDLAACYRLVDKFGMTALTYNHITARIPGSPDHRLS